MNDSVEEDPVIREIPIIHSSRLENCLHLFQYPLKRKECINEHKINKCFFKPQNKEVKLELGINTESPNFDTGRAEIIAHEVEGDKESNNKNVHFFENDIVDRVFLQSTKVAENPNRYAIAAYNGKEIHLTALKGIFQFRPSFPYMEKGMKRKIDSGDQDEHNEEQAGPSSAQQVTVKFKNDDRWKKNTSTSYKYLQAKRAEEVWGEYTWHNKSSNFSEIQRLKLLSDNLEDTSQGKNLTDMEYVKLLIPEDKEQTPLEPSLPSHVLSLHALRALPILEQCRQLLKDAQIMQFQQLCMVLAGGEGITADVILKTLPKVAVLVRGNWVVKSEVLYPANTFSATSGVPAELMCRARDYVLYCFTKNQYVERKKISSILKIPSEEIKEIFTGISKLRRHNKEWELHIPTDLDFINKHSELVNKQNIFWEQRFHQLSEFLKDNKTQRRKSRSESKSINEDGKVKSSVNSSDNDSGTEKNKSPIPSRKNKNGVLNYSDKLINVNS